MDNILNENDKPIFEFKTETDGLEVEFEVSTINSTSEYEESDDPIDEAIRNIDRKISANQELIDKLNADIERLTSHADGWDCTFAALSGVLTGLLDAFVVGEWNFADAKAISNKEINEKVMNFAKKDPEYLDFIKNKRKEENKDPNRLNNAIEFLEKKYKLPGDGAYKEFKSLGINDSTHHLDDFCHHPTLIGLICCILVQFTGNAKYSCSNGLKITTPVEVNQYGNLVSDKTWGKFFSGVINWFFNVVKTFKNWKGHLMSDIAGSSGAKREGSGLPGPFMSLFKELSALPVFDNSNFGEDLRKAFQNGIGNKPTQLDLKEFNILFEGASSKLDYRTEMAFGHEIKRQAVPVIINEILVRAFYFIRRFIDQMKDKRSIMELELKPLLPFKNRTIVRMMSIATATFTAVDVADAAIRSGGFKNPQILLRINYVGIGRFAIAIGADTAMGIKRARLRDERIAICCEQLYLLNAKTFYKQANMWEAAEDAEAAMEETKNMMNASVIFFQTAFQDITDDMKKIDGYIPLIEEQNPGLLDRISDILKWG